MTNISMVGDKRIRSRLKNDGLQHRVLEQTDENRALLERYNALVAEANSIPMRIAGLRKNYRKRDIAGAVDRLLTQREKALEQLIEIEKTLFPKDA